MKKESIDNHNLLSSTQLKFIFHKKLDRIEIKSGLATGMSHYTYIKINIDPPVFWGALHNSNLKAISSSRITVDGRSTIA